MSSSILLNLSSSVAIRLCIASVSLLICCWSNWSGFSSGTADGTITTADIPSPATPVAITLRNILPPYSYYIGEYLAIISHSSIVCTALNCQLAAGKQPQDAQNCLRFLAHSDLTIDRADSTVYFAGAFLQGFALADCTTATATRFRADFITPPYIHVMLTHVAPLRRGLGDAAPPDARSRYLRNYWVFVVFMIDHARQYSRFNDRHWDRAERHALLCDLPARRVVADPVAAFLAVPVDVARRIPIPTFLAALIPRDFSKARLPTHREWRG
jgi:hypothetical protein